VQEHLLASSPHDTHMDDKRVVVTVCGAGNSAQVMAHTALAVCSVVGLDHVCTPLSVFPSLHPESRSTDCSMQPRLMRMLVPMIHNFRSPSLPRRQHQVLVAQLASNPAVTVRVFAPFMDEAQRLKAAHTVGPIVVSNPDGTTTSGRWGDCWPAVLLPKGLCV
jgi:hypothetical protein